MMSLTFNMYRLLIVSTLIDLSHRFFGKNWLKGSLSVSEKFDLYQPEY